jgi:hypothetical protein
VENGFSLGNTEFKLRKLDPFTQFNMIRRLGPVLSDIVPVIAEMKKTTSVTDVEVMSENEKLEVFAKFFAPVMAGMSKLSDKDSDFVFHNLLHSAEIKHGQTWVKISDGKMLLMQNLELPTLLQVAGRAFWFNLGGFFPEPPRAL